MTSQECHRWSNYCRSVVAIHERDGDESQAKEWRSRVHRWEALAARAREAEEQFEVRLSEPLS